MEVERICLTVILLAVLARHSSFATANEDDCSKVAREKRTLEKMIELEYKVKEMEREMAKADGAFLSLLDGQNRRIAQIEESANVPTVAFSVYDPVNTNLSTGDTIIFGKALLNEGNNYSAVTGVFTAPIDGSYLFSVHICNRYGKSIVSAIVCNGKELSVSTQWDDTDSCGSVTALAKVKAGETVSVKCKYCQADAQLYKSELRWNSFTGHKI